MGELAERPVAYDVKTSEQLKIRITRENARLPTLTAPLADVIKLINDLGLDSNRHFLAKDLSIDNLFNTSLDPKVTIPCMLLLKKNGIDSEVFIFNPSLLFTHQAIYSTYGMSKACSKVRAHPLAKLASLINQLFGITIVGNLNMMA